MVGVIWKISSTSVLCGGIDGDWATAAEETRLWLEPLAEAGVEDLSLSSDTFHLGKEGGNPTQSAARVGGELNLSARTICIEAHH